MATENKVLIYVTSTVAVIEVNVGQGFAVSGSPDPWEEEE